MSANLVESLKLPWKTRHIVVAHHEWYNGLGYPRGIKGRAIPLGARIIAVVNAFFTMLSRRPGRSPLTKPEAMDELQKLSGTSIADMERFAVMYAASDSAIFVWSMGLTQHAFGSDNVRAVINLAVGSLRITSR